jgi:CelD/BcsL family acetyltransferase involved in cellulose biosynthesis
MGRGRAKAIQKKIARDLKYSSGGTDLERLRAELTGGSDHPAAEDDDEDETDIDDLDEDDELA